MDGDDGDSQGEFGGEIGLRDVGAKIADVKRGESRGLLDVYLRLHFRFRDRRRHGCS